MKDKIQYLINDGKFDVDNPISISNQNLGICQNSLSPYQVNTIKILPSYNKRTCTWNQNEQQQQ